MVFLLNRQKSFLQTVSPEPKVLSIKLKDGEHKLRLGEWRPPNGVTEPGFWALVLNQAAWIQTTAPPSTAYPGQVMYTFFCSLANWSLHDLRLRLGVGVGVCMTAKLIYVWRTLEGVLSSSPASLIIVCVSSHHCLFSSSVFYGLLSNKYYLTAFYLIPDNHFFALEMNRDHSVIFEIASKYCISDSSVDCDGYSISSKGFLPTAVDTMVIWVKFTHSSPL